MNPDELPAGLSPASLRCVNEILDVVVPYPEFADSLQGALSAVQWMREVRMPDGVLLLADSGMGKTLMLTLLKRTLTGDANPLKSSHPVLDIILDSAADVYQVATKLMLAVGYPALPTRPTLPSMTAMIDTAIERLRPMAILIDEGQHICEGNREKTARTVTDWLKVRVDKHNLPVIIVGTRTLEAIVDINSQFVSRVSKRYYLNTFAFGDMWRQVVGSIAESVRSLDLSSLSAPGLSRLVHEAAHGNLRRLKKLLLFSCVRAIDGGSPALKLEHLAAGYADAFGGPSGAANPFLAAIEKGKK